MEGGTISMIESVATGLTTVLGWIGAVLDALLGADGQLAELWPLAAIGISISAIFLTVKVFKGFSWGT